MRVTASGNLVAQIHETNRTVVMAYGVDWRNGNLNIAQRFGRYVKYKATGLWPDSLDGLNDCTQCTFGIRPGPHET
jgi:hypothetical protein